MCVYLCFIEYIFFVKINFLSVELNYRNYYSIMNYIVFVYEINLKRFLIMNFNLF